MMIFLKYLTSSVFIFSAITKLVDYRNTGELFGDLLGTNNLVALIVLPLLIFVELAVAFSILIDSLKNNNVYYLVTGLLVVFIIVNLIFTVSGKINCGCFGTKIVSSPFISIIKNILLLSSIYYLRKGYLSFISIL